MDWKQMEGWIFGICTQIILTGQRKLQNVMLPFRPIICQNGIWQREN